MKKVMYLINSLTVGGAETLVKDYAIQLNKEQFEVVIVVTGPSLNSIIEARLQQEEIKLIFMGDILTNSSTRFFSNPLNRIRHYHLFRKIVKKERPAIIHSHLGVNSYLCFINVKKYKIKLYHTLHSEVAVDFANSQKNNYYKTTHYCVHRKNMTLITLHQRMDTEARKLFSTQNTVILNNPVDIERFSKPTKSKEAIRKQLKLAEDAFVIGHVGRFSPPKNHSYLIDIFKEVTKRNKQAALLLVGSGELEQQVHEKVNHLGLDEKVFFLGNRTDIPELLSVMDRFVFPSSFEGLGIVLLEAQVAGVPCIVSDRVPQETNLSNYIAYLSLEDSVDIWLDKIIEEVPDKQLDDSISSFDLKNIMKKLEALYLLRGNVRKDSGR